MPNRLALSSNMTVSSIILCIFWCVAFVADIATSFPVSVKQGTLTISHDGIRPVFTRNNGSLSPNASIGELALLEASGESSKESASDEDTLCGSLGICEGQSDSEEKSSGESEDECSSLGICDDNAPDPTMGPLQQKFVDRTNFVNRDTCNEVKAATCYDTAMTCIQKAGNEPSKKVCDCYAAQLKCIKDVFCSQMISMGSWNSACQAACINTPLVCSGDDPGSSPTANIGPDPDIVQLDQDIGKMKALSNEK